MKQLAAVAVGRGDAHYDITIQDTVMHYKAWLDDNGFCYQKNLGTGMQRQLRPAPRECAST